MNGNPELIRGQIEELEKILDQFENEIQLPDIHSPLTKLELTQYLSLTRDDIERKLSVQDCSAIGFVLLQYSLFLQRTINRDKAKIIWGETALKKLIASEISHYTGSWDYQEQQAINANDTASRLQKSIIVAKMKVSRLYNVSNSIENIVKQLQNIQFAKRDKIHEKESK